MAYGTVLLSAFGNNSIHAPELKTAVHVQDAAGLIVFLCGELLAVGGACLSLAEVSWLALRYGLHIANIFINLHYCTADNELITEPLNNRSITNIDICKSMITNIYWNWNTYLLLSFVFVMTNRLSNRRWNVRNNHNLLNSYILQTQYYQLINFKWAFAISCYTVIPLYPLGYKNL